MSTTTPNGQSIATFRSAAALLCIPLVGAGCNNQKDVADIQAPGVSIKAGPGGTEIVAPGVNIKAGPDGAQVSAPGVDVKSGAGGAEVSAGGVSVRADGTDTQVSAPSVVIHAGPGGASVEVTGIEDGEGNHAASLEPLSPEMEVLGRLIGKWKNEIHLKPSKTQAAEVRHQGKTEFRWFLGRRFVSIGPANSPDFKLQEFTLATFDPQREAYRWWIFKSDGTAVHLRGKWNADTSTLTFNNDDEMDPVSARMTIKFIDDNAIDTSVVVKNSEDAVILDLESKLTR